MSPPKLTPEEIVQFHKNGYFVLEQVTTLEDIERIRELLDGLYDRFDELDEKLVFDLGDLKYHDGTQKTPQINAATRFEPRLKETLAFKNTGEVAKQLLGEEALFRFDHSIYKPPKNEKEVPWHQDLAYGGNQDRGSWNVAFWLSLQDVAVETGCMQFIPHSHLGNLKFHHPIDNDPKIHTLITDGVDSSQAVACPISAGSATIHLPKTLHYTGPNMTDMPRRAWILNYSVPLNP